MASKKEKTIGKVLFTQEQISKRAEELCQQIEKDFEGKDIILLGTLKGSVLWMGEIMKHMKSDAQIDFICASSYGSSTKSSGVVKISYEPTANMYNKNIIVIEDIVDTGNTLKYLKAKLAERGPKSVTVCTMLNKEARRTTDLKPDYVGFEVDDLFVVGFGLDYDQRFRCLPYVSYLEEDDIESI